MRSELISRKTELSANVVAFCRYLRTKGFPLGPREEADALEALAIVPFTDPETFRLTLRAVLPRSIAHQLVFDELYEEYWRELERAINDKVKDQETEGQAQAPKAQKQPSIQTIKNWLYQNHTEEEVELAAYSGGEVLTQKDFASFSDHELEEVMKLIQTIARSLATRYNRRFIASHSHRNFDLRRSIRLNMRRGGEIMELAFKQKRIRKLKLVTLCDVSKSMDLYSQFLIQFLYGFQQVYSRIETFVFSTSLHRITEHLQHRKLEDTLEQLSWRIPDWSGGTRIGESLDYFVQHYSKKLLDDRTVVMILSDGWDTGQVELLESSMKAIHQKAARVIWLNPLAGNPAFEPSVQGMEIAMPYIDIFAPAHNVDSLRKLIRML